MPNAIEKLIGLIYESTGATYGGEYGDEEIEAEIDISDEEIERIADRLIANGATVPVRCKNCAFAVCHDEVHKTVLCQQRSAYPKQWDNMPFDGFCSYGKSREADGKSTSADVYRRRYIGRWN